MQEQGLDFVTYFRVIAPSTTARGICVRLWVKFEHNSNHQRSATCVRGHLSLTTRVSHRVDRHTGQASHESRFAWALYMQRFSGIGWNHALKLESPPAPSESLLRYTTPPCHLHTQYLSKEPCHPALHLRPAAPSFTHLDTPDTHLFSKRDQRRNT